VVKVYFTTVVICFFDKGMILMTLRTTLSLEPP